jgi:tetratricopeptide (TPR) repeat protein
VEVRLVSYDIVFDRLVLPGEAPPPEVDRQSQELYDLVHDAPKKTIPRLEALLARYPDVPLLYNYLTVACSLAGDKQRVEELTMEAFRRRPDYLFARLNYAAGFLAKNDLEGFAEAMEHKFDLSLLYPERRVFHISEFKAFAHVMGEYYARRGEIDAAEMLLEVLEEMLPDDPVTENLAEAIGLWRMRKAVEGILALTKKPSRAKRKPKGRKKKES